jgi:hypothetical protein
VFIERRDKSSSEAQIVARESIPTSSRRIELRISGAGKLLSFAYRFGDDAAWQVLAADLDGSLLSTQDAGGFVGAVVGLYARLPVEPLAQLPKISEAITPSVSFVSQKNVAEIPVKSMPAGPDEAWQPSFADGALALDAFEGFGMQGAFSQQVTPRSGLLQSFRGNGQKLKAIAFCFASTASPLPGAKYKLMVIDYGSQDPTRSAVTLNANHQVLATGTFTLSDQSKPCQHYFDLSAADIKLDPEHRYGVALQFTDATRSLSIYRSVVDAVPDGRLAFGISGAYAYDFAGGDRDAHFALYGNRR